MLLYLTKNILNFCPTLRGQVGSGEVFDLSATDTRLQELSGRDGKLGRSDKTVLEKMANWGGFLPVSARK